MKLNMFKIILLVLFSLLGLSGCGSAKIVNIPNQNIERNLPLHDVGKAIEYALMQNRWVLVEKKSDEYIARLSRGRWSVDILIVYSKDAYSIKYLSSKNLKYNAEKQTIHPGYNKYIARLKRQIDLNLNTAVATQMIKIDIDEQKVTPVTQERELETKNTDTEVEPVSKEVEIW
jgi:PBP1b-binding outer membrane lipoprotein LpoB